MAVQQRLVEFGIQGREIYQKFVYTIDLVFPLTFLVFLALLAYFVAERTTIAKRNRVLLLAIPMVWFLMDMIENTMTFTLISQFPRPTQMIAGLIGYITVIKFTLLITSLLVPLTVFGLYRIKYEQKTSHLDKA